MYAEAPRNVTGQLALTLYNDVAIIRETGWTEQELLDASEEMVWAITHVMDLESQRMKRETEDQKRQSGNASNPDYRPRAPLPPPPPPGTSAPPVGSPLPR